MNYVYEHQFLHCLNRNEDQVYWANLIIVPLCLYLIYKWITKKATSGVQIKPIQKRKIQKLLIPTKSCPPRLHSDEQLTLEKLLKMRAKKENTCTELIQAYREGGYMPVSIGQILGPYQILRKLGWGTFSTVWLSKNLKQKNTYCAIKISKAALRNRAAAKQEAHMLLWVKHNDVKHAGYKHIVQFYDHFYAQSVHGVHVCLTFELMGPSLHQLLKQSNFQGLEQDGVRSIITQALRGLSYMHDKCKLIHTDIKPDNILVVARKPYIRNMIQELNYYKQFGIEMPKSYVKATETTLSSDNKLGLYQAKNKMRITSFSCPNKSETSEVGTKVKSKLNNTGMVPMFVDPDIQIKITDLGNACTKNNTYFMVQTLPYRAPEVIIEGNYGYPIDVWSVGCLAYELCTGNYLFNTSPSCAEKHLSMIGKTLGEIPPHVALSGQKSMQYFLPSGTLKTVAESIYDSPIETRLLTQYKWNKEDAKSLTEFVESLLELDQTVRVTASAALNSPWLTKENN